MIRLATLADTAAIVALYREARMKQAAGVDVPVPDYDDLTLFERWQDGGAWATIETCAIHLNRLLTGVGVPLVAERNGQTSSATQLVGEAEVYESFEPQPYGHHLYIDTLITKSAGRMDQNSFDELWKYVAEMARLMKCERVICTLDADDPRIEMFDLAGFKPFTKVLRICFSAQEGRAFYQTSELTDRNPDQIKGWAMPLGRSSSSREAWNRLFPQDWAAGIPELLNRSTTHLKLTVTGQNAIISMQDTDTPGEASIMCWVARPLSMPLLTAIRDCAFRAGYRSIVSYVTQHDLALFGADAEIVDEGKLCLGLVLS